MKIKWLVLWQSITNYKLERRNMYDKIQLQNL